MLNNLRVLLSRQLNKCNQPTNQPTNQPFTTTNLPIAKRLEICFEPRLRSRHYLRTTGWMDGLDGLDGMVWIGDWGKWGSSQLPEFIGKKVSLKLAAKAPENGFSPWKFGESEHWKTHPFFRCELLVLGRGTSPTICTMLRWYPCVNYYYWLYKSPNMEGLDVGVRTQLIPWFAHSPENGRFAKRSGFLLGFKDLFSGTFWFVSGRVSGLVEGGKPSQFGTNHLSSSTNHLTPRNLGELTKGELTHPGTRGNLLSHAGKNHHLPSP